MDVIFGAAAPRLRRTHQLNFDQTLRAERNFHAALRGLRRERHEYLVTLRQCLQDFRPVHHLAEMG